VYTVPKNGGPPSTAAAAASVAVAGRWWRLEAVRRSPRVRVGQPLGWADVAGRHAGAARAWCGPRQRHGSPGPQRAERQVGVGKVRGPGAMMSAQSGAAPYVGHRGPDCCCCARAELLSNRVMPAYDAFALREAVCRPGAIGARESGPSYRRVRVPENRGEL
jgi:hypothetical protein